MYTLSYDTILVRYGELSTKGKNRKDFIHVLKRNIKETLAQFSNLGYRETYDRLYIELNGEDSSEVSALLKNVFGIRSFSLAHRCASSIDVIVEDAFRSVADEQGKTFKVITKRHDKSFPLSSDQVNRLIADYVLEKTDLQVDVHSPQLKVLVEIRAQDTYIMVKTILGAQGFPVGIGGKAMVLLSGGIDSPVAAYLMMKRGIKIEAIHFASPPFTSSQAQKKVEDLTQQLTAYQGLIRLHIVNFTEIQTAIHREVNPSYEITIMRRFMMRIAQRLAYDYNCLALANGESIGQVASQTLQSMQVISHGIEIPILRPLVTYDKLEIIDIAKAIHTYETSILPFEDCCTIFTPQSPITKPHLDKAEYYEARLDVDGLIASCLKTVEVKMIRHSVGDSTVDQFF